MPTPTSPKMAAVRKMLNKPPKDTAEDKTKEGYDEDGNVVKRYPIKKGIRWGLR